ncbi:UDP-2,4-diacetamido-2,4,6-trideoxy-beta-L-altropyranose hydrolase [Namhaeicola litoreus]|uniref:UDP-2,4-diacetamido-2,4, 6-trideoxy-beta-L-altropyranose hydrolase n=1 Tax=Namhaeicola litoreus TaxID=1052145 RepID=A0ABW3Y353_9FLAO
MDKPKVIIRVDGNSTIGLGHIYRGIALAEMLRDTFSIIFVTKKDSIQTPIHEAGFEVTLLADTLSFEDEPIWFHKNYTRRNIIVLDGYDFEENYQQQIKKFGFRLIYIDDLVRGVQKADVVINHSPGIKTSDYKVEPYTKLALGLDFALVRRPFLNASCTQSLSSKQFKNVFVSFGGADSNDFSFKVVEQLVKVKDITKIFVLLGAAYKHDQLISLKSEKVKLFKNSSENVVFEIMCKSDFAIVPASTISLELLFLNKPMLLGYFVLNQKNIYHGLIENKMAIPLGDFNKFDFSRLEFNLKSYISKIKKLMLYNNYNSKKNIQQLFE